MSEEMISELGEASVIPIKVSEGSFLLQGKEPASSTAEKYQVKLGDWVGPYDVLLKVIDEKEMDLFDLNISELLFHYLEHIQVLEMIDLDEAGEFLVVGASLAQIKSKMLLPREEQKDDEEEDETDPRTELVHYLIEYKKFREAADQLRDRPVLNRDVFLKGAKEQFDGGESEGRGQLFQLVKGFQKAFDRRTQSQSFEVEMEEVSVSERFHEIFQLLLKQSEIEFQSLMPATSSKSYLVASFLAVLELVRLKKIKILQMDSDSHLFLRLVAGASEDDLDHSEFDESADEEAPPPMTPKEQKA